MLLTTSHRWDPYSRTQDYELIVRIAPAVRYIVRFEAAMVPRAFAVVVTSERTNHGKPKRLYNRVPGHRNLPIAGGGPSDISERRECVAPASSRPPACRRALRRMAYLLPLWTSI